MTYNELVKEVVLEAIKDLERPSHITNQELLNRVRELWQVRNIEITSGMIGRIMNKEDFASYRTSKERGWIII